MHGALYIRILSILTVPNAILVYRFYYFLRKFLLFLSLR